MNRDLPTYIVMTSRGGSGDANFIVQPFVVVRLSTRSIPGVKFRNSGDQVYYLSNLKASTATCGGTCLMTLGR